MKKYEVYNIFYKQDKICFSKGYEVFEEVYNELKEKLNLKRKEEKHFGWTEVIIIKE